MRIKKKIVAAWLFLFVSIICFSQSAEIKVFSNEKPLGKDLISEQEIIGQEYIFPDRIYRTYLDTTNSYLTVQLRGLSRNGKYLNNKGNILLYDLKKNNLKWTKKIAYQTSSLQQYSNMMIQTVGNKSYCMDIENGEELWELKNDIYYVDPLNDIGIGYKYKGSTGYSNTLEGIDLNNGSVIWNKKLNREYGWNKIFHLNDSILLIVAGGLHTVNIKDGSGWDYSTITGEKDYSGTAATNALGVASGLLTGNFFLSIGHNLVRDIVSNVQMDSSSLYFASKEKLSSVNIEDGSANWTNPFREGFASKSLLLMNDSALLVINKGYAFMGYRQLDYGRPFIASYDIQTGEQHYLSVIMVENDPILGVQILNDKLFLLFKNRLAKLSIKNGGVLLEKEITSTENGSLKYYVGNQAYIARDDDTYKSLITSDSSKLFVFTESGNTLVIDDQLKIVDTVELEDIFVNYINTGSHRFIAKENSSWILNSAGERIAELEASSEAFLIGYKLYDRYDDRFKVIDLKEIIGLENLLP